MITDEQVKAAMQAYNEHIDGDVGLEETFRAVLEVYEASKWISVEERLPTPYESVIVRFESIQLDEFGYINKSYTAIFDGVFYDCDPVNDGCKVTHWQKLQNLRSES